ncbi:ABC transporter permease [Clostridium algidicarnis]|uniref:ABC-2 type transport system permease protein n=2 Tax=Clostridium algidicarnis TaxID=37659 RepID=A0A2S6FYL6_9CLOT|nr:ABC transporter permease [Clostridium algidicarnis]MBU3193168.1 ABC transporter permease [Clostridium algidicarnis]MBU3196214.1 ABC transporter permease [Clostridium algidicarnis]MBU3220615.1 ABC transporter permease [Clostridium algidicarnis]MCB2287276.1 ABC transporter permease [Clostridium algidicarnis]PPK48635.1 ABC-2 type transport system permease protein [Clostridium algidicarnis DSM 15099]
MTIVINNIRRILKDKMALSFMIVWPILIIVFLNISNPKSQSINIGVIDEDNSKVSSMIKDNLNNLSKFKTYETKQEDIKEELIDEKSDYIIYIEKGYEENLLKGNKPIIKSYSLSGGNVEIPVKISLENYGNVLNNIAQSTIGSEEKFYEAMRNYEEGNLKLLDKTIDKGMASSRKVFQYLGFLVMGILSLGTVGCSFIVEDKKGNMDERLFSAPLSRKSYMIQNILSGILIAFIQITILMVFLKVLLKINLDYKFLQLYFIMMLFGLVSVSLGIFLNSISKNSRQFSLIGTMILTPFCMLGGCFWPREVMPNILINISKFIPTTWAMEASRRALSGNNMGDLFYEIAILLLFAVVFLILSSWKPSEMKR